MTGSMSPGHDPNYYTKGGQSRDTYYTGGATQGEPPGRWFAVGRNALGLQGEVTAEAMKALYAQGYDPRDPRFWSEDPKERAQCERLGAGPKTYKSKDDILIDRLATLGRVTPERVAEIRAASAGMTAKQVAQRVAIEGLLLPEAVRRADAEADRMTRQSVMFMDCTYSPPKSVTVYHTGLARSEHEATQRGDAADAARYRALRQDVEESIYEAAEEFVTHLYEKAGYARVGRHGKGESGRWERSEGWTVAQFFQHTSRDGDPQLHVHGAVLNKQMCQDGKVRALDTALMMASRQGAGTIADLSLAQAISRRHATRGVGVRWRMRADGVGREMVGVDQAAMDLFSERRKHIGVKLQKLADQFRAATGREPNPLEMSRLSTRAALATRRPKSATANMNREEQLRAWDEKLRNEVVSGLTAVADTVASGKVEDAVAEQWSPSGVIAEATAACQAKHAAWSRSELEKQIALALPDNLGPELPAGAVRKIVDRLAEQALSNEKVVKVSGHEMTGDVLPDTYRLGAGESSFVSPGAARYCTEGHVVAEQAIRRAAVLRERLAVSRKAVDEWIANRGQVLGTLGADQEAALKGILTSGANTSVLIGPAGAGKSFTMGALTSAWSDLTQCKVVGIATSEAATNVLREEGLNAKNSAQWLAAQERITAGRATADDMQWVVDEGDMLVVDEAAMVDHDTLVKIQEVADRCGARIIQAGDPAQVGAVGAGGTMSMLAGTEGVDVHTLTEVRRFTARWEREASLRLRSGDTEVIGEYDRRGRVVDSGTLANAMHQAATSFVAEHLAGVNAVVVVSSNERAATVSSMVRSRLQRLGRVGDDAAVLRDGTAAGVGDLVQARRNDWPLGVTNRRRYVVVASNEDGSLVVDATDGSGRRVMPAAYVAADVTLGYAGTAHAVQGLTVDVCDPVVDPSMSQEALYMAMTRGRRRNTARVATQPEADDQETGETHAREQLSAVGVIRDILDRGITAEDAAVTQYEAELAAHGSNLNIHARHEEAMRHVSRTRTELWLDELNASGVLSDEARLRLAADQGTEQLGRLLRVVEQAGKDPKVVLEQACAGSFDGLRSAAQGVQGRIKAQFPDELRPAVEQMNTGTPAGLSDQMGRYVDKLAEMADERRRELGSDAAETQPRWAVETLGPVPNGVVERMEWEAKAGVVAAHREATGFEDEARPLPNAPGVSSTELRASWHAAWSALGRPEAGKEEQDLSDGLLRARVKAWEREQEWAPKFVDDDMRATGQKVVDAQQKSTLLEFEADVAASRGEDQEADRLRQEALDQAAQAEVMARIEADLERLAEERAAWFAETAVTQDVAMRAAEELAARGRGVGEEPDRVTAEEWMRAHEESMAAEDRHRPVTEVDLADDQDEEEDMAAAPQAPEVTEEAESVTELPAEVPTLADVDEALVRARLAAAEIADRRSAEAARPADEASGSAARVQAWRADEEMTRQAEQVAVDEMSY